MVKENVSILTINAGSSSIKFACYEIQDHPARQLSGKIEHIGLHDTQLVVQNHNNDRIEQPIQATDFHTATTSLIEWLAKQEWFPKMKAIGHRIVHGMKNTEPTIIGDCLLKELSAISIYDPDHLPAEIEIIQLLKQKYPGLLQIACFDTSFHTTIPVVAKTFAIPKRYYDEGIQRFGFHGISYTYLMDELRKNNQKEADGLIILAHLGNGASMAAVKNGKCIDTTMGFTPAGGLVMSTRSGDLDPGILWYLMQKGVDANTFSDLINHKSGLLGISGMSSDMQELLKHETGSPDAALAIDIFCYQVRKYIGAFTAVLGGLDTLVFSGGIGENSATNSARIFKCLSYGQISLYEESNNKNERLISDDQSRVKVYVIPTNEELVIATATAALYENRQKNN